jgi:hypothetical protein
LAGLLATYAAAAAATSLFIALTTGQRFLLALPLVFLCLHVAYGVGQWHAVLSRFFGRDRGLRRKG